MTRAWVQQWTESERGWGERPDGFTAHRTHADLTKYIADYWAGMPDEAPDEYSKPDGKPFQYEVDDKLLPPVGETGAVLPASWYPENDAELPLAWRRGK